MGSTASKSQQIVNEFYHSVAKEHQRLNGWALHYTKDPDKANDLVQETICKALANHEKFSKGTNLRGWLHTILRNTFRSQLKRAKLQNKTFDQNVDPLQLHIYEYAGGYSTMVMNEISREINQLKDQHRIPFELALKGYKYHEIAELLNITIENVKVRIHLARKQLRASLHAYKSGINL